MDTLCLPISTVKILAASHEKYIFSDSLIKIQDEEILLLRQVIEEKQTQENLNEGLLSTFRAEIDKLRRHRMLLGIGLGATGAAILVLIL